MRIHYDITIFGKVQGVFYRQSSLAIASQIGVKGFVRNEPNGNVYIEAEGNEEGLNEFLEWCRIGPELAKVKSVQFNEGPIKNFSSFEIRK